MVTISAWLLTKKSKKPAGVAALHSALFSAAVGVHIVLSASSPVDLFLCDYKSELKEAHAAAEVAGLTRSLTFAVHVVVEIRGNVFRRDRRTRPGSHRLPF